jgi:LysM repeat protein
MKPVFHLLSLGVILLSLNGCRTASPQANNVGPFDADGNYVDAWADNPPAGRTYKPKEIEVDLPTVASNEQPPLHSVPLASNAPKPTKPVMSSPRPKPTSTAVATRSTPKTRSTASTSSKPKSKTVVAKTKPKSTVAKAKPKPKPTVVRHTVRKGDSLSSLAAKYGSSVSAIKSANGLSGTLIIDGKSLVIPRKK